MIPKMPEIPIVDPAVWNIAGMALALYEDQKLANRGADIKFEWFLPWVYDAKIILRVPPHATDAFYHIG